MIIEITSYTLYRSSLNVKCYFVSVQNQRLLVPQNLELTAANETILLDNLHIFEKNGFEFSIDDSQVMGQVTNISYNIILV